MVCMFPLASWMLGGANLSLGIGSFVATIVRVLVGFRAGAERIVLGKVKHPSPATIYFTQSQHYRLFIPVAIVLGNV